MSVSSIGGLSSSLSFARAPGPDDEARSDLASFRDVLASQLAGDTPQALPDFSWRTYFRAKYNSDDEISQKRLAAIRKRDPALAARLEVILKLPLSEQQAAITDIELTLAKRVAETRPDDKATAAHHRNKAVVASGVDSSSTFAPDNIARWI
ncbi:MAG: hypothetical protein H7338_20135 [Candidatus Sericytochromatia bacterium]|nr:hypothetical protein [Candidatus Sericytochromatia bacterium]